MDTTAFNALLAASGLAVLVFACASRPLKHLLTLPLTAFAIGILIGPAVFDWVALPSSETGHLVLEELARATLAISLIGVALRFDRESLRRWIGPGALLLTGGMFAMWFVTSGLTALLTDLSVTQAALVGAILTPTDPVVASSIASGEVAQRHVPHRLRQLLSLESGANDGLAYLFVLLPILLISKPESAWHDWIVHTLLWQVCAAAVIGALIGKLFGRLLPHARHSDDSSTPNVLSGVLALAIVLVGALKLLHTDGILAVFVGGVAFSLQLGAEIREHLAQVAEATGKVILTALFILFATVLPWQAWQQMGSVILVLVGAVLLLRRLPAVWLLTRHLRGAAHLRDRLFLGWFGPLGVSSLFYALLALRKLGDPRLFVVSTAVIAGSVLIHGLTAGPLTVAYGRREGRTADGA